MCVLVYSIWPAVLRQATYGTIKFGTYYTLKKFTLENGYLLDKHGNERVLCNVLCAVTGISMASPYFSRNITIQHNLKIFEFVEYSWCNIVSDSNTNRCTQSTDASTWPWHWANWPNWLFPRNLSLRRNCWFMAGRWTHTTNNIHMISVYCCWLQGLGPTAQRAAVIAAVELPVYDFCKSHLLDTFGDHVANHFM